MTKLSNRFAILLSFLLLAACGETLKSNQLDSSSEEAQSNYYDVYEARASQNSNETDIEIYRAYQFDLGPTSYQEGLARSIGAFDTVLAPSGSSQVRIRSRITLGCGEVIDFNRTFSMQTATQGREMDLGTSNGYQIRLRCTNNRCSEMVAIINRLVDGAGILAGMQVNSKVNNELVYVARYVEYYSYFMFQSGSAFNEHKSCDFNTLYDTDSSFGDLIQEELGERFREEAENWLRNLLNL